MASDSIHLLGFVGTLTQLGGTLLLATLFAALHAHARRTPFFRAWTWAWGAVVLAIGAVSLRYSTLPSLAGPPFADLPDESLTIRALDFAYIIGKLLFLAQLVVGTRLYVRGHVTPAFLRVVAGLCVGYALVTTTLAPTLNAIMVWQSVVAVPVFARCAVKLHRLPASRRSWGSLALGGVFWLLAVLWAMYGAGFGYVVLHGAETDANPFRLLLSYNSFVDSLIQMLLGFGMVILLLEDARRQISDAHAELAAAHDQLRHAALFDALTGALNRRAFTEGLGLERVRASFGTVAVLDSDNLKYVNDTHGHEVGDALLRHLVAVLVVGLRPTDKIYRWGGDEFVVLMPGASADNAMRRLASLIGRAEPLAAGETTVPVLASIGVAEFASASELDEALRLADAAMFVRKAEGKRARLAAAAADAPPGVALPTPRRLRAMA